MNISIIGIFRKWFPWVILITIFFSLRFYRINEPLIDMHNVRQTQTAMIARNLVEDHFNFFLTRIDWDGDNSGFVLQEFPLYQLIVGAIGKMVGTYDIVGRVISILFSSVAALYLFKISKMIFSEGVGYWAVAFFSISPIAVFMSRAFMINMCSFSLSMVALYYWIVWGMNRNIRVIAVSTIALTFASLINPTIILPVVVVILYITVKKWENKIRFYYIMAGFATLFIVPNLLWNLQVSNVNFIYYPQWRGGALIEHFLGLDTSRFDLFRWFRICIYLFFFGIGIHGLFLILIGMKIVWKERADSGRVLIAWLAGGVLYYFLFFKALSGHNYYMLPIIPILGIFVGKGVEYLVKEGQRMLRMAISSIFICTLPIWIILAIFHSTQEDFISYQAGIRAKEYTKKSDYILVAVLHTNEASVVYPTILYYAERRGWNIATTFDPEINLEEVKNLQLKGAKLLVVTFGKPAIDRIGSKFPFYRYFSHEVELDIKENIRGLKNRYAVLEEQPNYIIFRL